MEKVEELAEALKAVEDELNLAKRVYLAFPFIFWSFAIPFMYLLELILIKYAGLESDYVSVTISLLFVAWFLIENTRVFRKVEAIERVLGRRRERKLSYAVSQVLAWFVAFFIASYLYGTGGKGMLLFVGLALLLMVAVDLSFHRRVQSEMVLAGFIILSSTYLADKLPVQEMAFAIMVISSAFSFAAFLHIRRAMRE